MRISDWSSDVCSSDLSAIFQCLDHDWPLRVSRVVLTASGGPFRNADLDIMRHATPEQAAAHPTWSMGAKISIDSATLMNQGLDLIEATHLFPIPADQMDVLINPRSEERRVGKEGVSRCRSRG